MFSGSDIDDSIFTLEYADSIPSLSKAARVGDLETVRRLLSAGFLPQTPDNKGWTAIHCCVYANQLEVLKLILELKSENKNYLVNLLTWENDSPLIIALRSSQPSIDMVNLLLKSGADPNHRTHTKITPLHIACLENGNLHFVKLLIEHGADVNVQEDFRLCTPLHYAISEARDLDIIKQLIDICDLKLMNASNRCAFLEACSSNFLEAVEIFIEKDKAFANLKSSKPPLVYACIWGNMKMVELLINSGADVHSRCKAIISSRPGESDFFFDQDDFFPIHSSLNSLEVYTFLLEHTHPAQLLQLEKKYYTFPLFVLLFGGNSCFFETLMQSHYPPELKIINCRVLIHFVLSYPLDMDYYIVRIFPLLFKYNFYFEPENIFQNFVCQLSYEEVCMHFKVFHFIAQMGIPSEDEFENKKTVIRIFESLIRSNSGCDELKTFRSICDLLSQSVLTLKQYCRIAVRRRIKSEWAKELAEGKTPPANTLGERGTIAKETGAITRVKYVKRLSAESVQTN